jgi:hypothetical protein
VYPPIIAAGGFHFNLTRLHTLALSGYEEDEFPYQLLQQLNLPSLQAFSFRLRGGSQRFVAALNSPCLQAIQKLDIYFFIVWQEDYADVVEEVVHSLRPLTNLETLRCHIYDKPQSADRIFQALSQDSFLKEPAFTRLRVLEIVGEIEEPENLICLQEFLHIYISPVDVPVDSRKALRSVSVVVDCSDLMDSDSEVTTTQLSKPTRYNDRFTSVIVSLKVKGDGASAVPGWFLEVEGF